MQAMLAHHRCDAQSIVLEYAGPTTRLSAAVLLGPAPLRYRLLIPPEGKGKEFSRIGETLEALDRKEPSI
jgi:hypothetical protein